MSRYAARLFTCRQLLAVCLLLISAALPLQAWAVDGELDTTFGTGGIATMAVGAGNEQINAIVQQTDGKLVAAGFTNNGANNDFLLARYNTNGSLDTGFGNVGIVITAVGSSTDQANALIIQPDGKLVAAGYSSNGTDNDFALVRYNTDGSLDTTFGNSGKAVTPIGSGADVVNSLIRLSDGGLVVAGYSYNGTNSDFAIARYNANGSLDTTFGTGGKTITPVGSYSDIAYALTQQTDGTLVLVGCAATSSSGSCTLNGDFAVVRYTANGALDTTFGTGGKLTTAVSAAYMDLATSVVQQADGKLLVGGQVCLTSSLFCTNADFVLLRYNSDGSLDTTFGTTGIVTTAIGTGNEYAYAMILDGAKPVLAGYSKGTTENFSLVRYTSGGALDTSFSSDGKLTTAINAKNSRALALLKQSDGNYVAAGFVYNGTNNDLALVRYLSAPTDTDGDGITDVLDNCPAVSNATQTDTDADGIGDACDTTAYGNTDTDNDTLPDLWETAHGRNPNVADYTIFTRYANSRYELCAKDDSGTHCWDFAGNSLAITPFTTSNYSRAAIYVGQCGSFPIDCSGKPPQWVSPTSCTSNGTGILCVTQCFGYLAQYSYGGSVCTNSPTGYAVYDSDPGIWFCQMESAGFKCYAVTLQGMKTGAALNIPIAFNVDSDGDGSSRPFDPDDLNPDVYPLNDRDSDGVLDGVDNCFQTPNPDQLNTDGDAQGNACDDDDDNDGVLDINDALPLDATESVDTDHDGVGDNSDNCPSNANSNQLDTDGDGLGDACDSDDDNDGVLDVSDACPLDTTASVGNTDGDDLCDVNDIDDDNDGVLDGMDNCPLNANADQLDTDSDGLGNVCDSDDDNDGVPDVSDALPLDATESIDTDHDGIGNNVDTDDDGDGVADVNDAFPLDSCAVTDTDSDGMPDKLYCYTSNGWSSGGYIYNTFTMDVDLLAPQKLTYSADYSDAGHTNTFSNASGSTLSAGHHTLTWRFQSNCAGGACLQPVGVSNIKIGSTTLVEDLDDDNDGVPDISDAFPLDATESVDTDGDGVGDNADTTPNGDTDSDGVDNLSDNCPTVSNADQLNTDGDAEGNACDADDDNDGVVDASDAFPLDASESVDADGDGIGDNADTTPNGDTDSDGVDNLSDNCVSVSNADQLNADGDALGDACDTTPNGDTDNDGVDNLADNCVSVSNADQLDTDHDGIGDVCDTAPNGDTDSDGVDNLTDNCPTIPNPDQLNTDGDAQGDLCDIFPLDALLLLQQDGTEKTEHLGISVAAADMNGDGVDDVLIGSPMATVFTASKPLKKAGIIQIISGVDGSVRTLPGSAANQQFGTAIAVVEDQNSDNTPDVIVGEPLANIVTTVNSKPRTLKKAGRVVLVSGADGSLINVIAEGRRAGDNFGAAVAVGDVNNDAIVDLVVGAPLSDKRTKDGGEIFVYNGISSTLLYARSGYGHFGAAVAVDNQHRVYVGSPWCDTYSTVNGISKKLVKAGRVSVYNGATGNGWDLLTIAGANTGDTFGAAVSTSTKNNQWIVGIPLSDSNRKDAGSVQVFDGLNSTPIATINGNLAGDNFGSAVSLQGDVNSDGVNDLAIGATKVDVSNTVESKTMVLKDAGSVQVLNGAALPP